MKTKFTIWAAMIIAVMPGSLQRVNAQWLLTGNPTATPSSILGPTSPTVPLNIYSGGLFRMKIDGTNGNVGIGLSSPLLLPAAKLDINSTTAGQLVRFNGGVSNLWMGLYENGAYRGYFGSYAGNNEDIDFGTGAGTSGKLHLTIQASPKLTIDKAGSVGIGTTTPDDILTVLSKPYNNLLTVNGTSHFLSNVKIGTDDITASNVFLEFGPYSSLLFDNNQYIIKHSASGEGIYNSQATERYEIRGHFPDSLRITPSTIRFYRQSGNGYFKGSLGIGIDSPYRKLQVENGDIRIEDSLASDRYLEFVSKGPSKYDYRFDHRTDKGGLLWVSGSNNNFKTDLDYKDLAVFNAGPKYGDTTSFGIFSKYVFTIFGSGLASGGIWVNSDQKLKQDINNVSGALDIIKQLQPKTYFFKKTGYENLNLPSQKQYGFIAQEMEKVLPDLVNTTQQPVRTDAKGERQMEDVKSVNYNELIPLLTKAIQEQQERIEALEQKIAALSQGNVSTKGAGTNAIATSAARLEQNAPNPFTSSTVIRYYVPSNVLNAQILITDVNGRTLKTISINNKNNGQVTLSGNELSAGNYFCTLIANGEKADTKQMVLIK